MKTATVLTYGCTHNQKDTQLIEAQLLHDGYQLVDETEANLVIVNTCTVKQPTENRIITKLDELQGEKRVIVTGCLSQSNPELIRNRYPEFLVMGVNAAPTLITELKLHEKLQDARSRNLLHLPMSDVNASKNLTILKTPINEKIFDKPNEDSHMWNPNLNIIQINEGCLNNCSFCATKLARGRLQSFSVQSIVSSIRKMPTPEVWLTSQDTGCYGFDLKTSLVELLREVDLINRQVFVRVGMGNPNNFIKILEEVVEAFNSPKVYKFLHLPVQSGSNEVLKHMKRGYTVEEYEQIVAAFRKQFPDLTLSTDIIVGYPTETEEDFEKTLVTLKNTRPSITNISKYWERKGTPAAELKQLPHAIRKKRGKVVTALTEKMQKEDNQHWLNWTGSALIVAKAPKGGMEARNEYYKPIILPEGEIGSWVSVKITEVTSTYFMGKIINKNE